MRLLEYELNQYIQKDWQHRRLMVIGRMEHVEEICHILEDRGLKVEAVLDNDPKKQGSRLGIIPISAPSDILAEQDSSILILIYSPRYWEEMTEQFAGYGYREPGNVLVLDRPSESRSRRDVLRGYQTYLRLRRQYGRDVRIFMASCPLGDYYLLGLFFHQYCEREGIANYVMTGESSGITKLSEAFGIHNCVRLDRRSCDELVRAFLFLGEGRIPMKVLTIWQGAFRFNPCLVRQQKQFSFLDTFRSFIFGLPEDTVPRLPAFKQADDRLREIFAELSLRPGRTVILAVHAYSMQTLSPEFWRSLVERLTEENLDVVVNVDKGRGEEGIQGVSQLSLPLMQMKAAVEYAGSILGIRSGLFDIISSARAKKIALYPAAGEKTNSHWNSTDLYFNSLNRMRLCSDAIEIEYMTDREDACLEEILHYYT